MSAERMASGNAFECKPSAFECTVFSDSLKGILRTGRRIAAARRYQRADAVLVKPYQGKQAFGQQEIHFDTPLPVEADGNLAACLFFTHKLGKLLARLCGVCRIESLPDAHNKVMRRQAVAVESEPVADHAFHIIACIGAFGGFLADDHAQTRMIQTVVRCLGNLQQIAASSVSECKNG